MVEMIRVLLADNHPLARAGIRATLAHEEQIAIVGEATNGAEVQRLSMTLQPDVLLVDLDMPGPLAIETVACLHQACAAMKILVLSSCNESSYARSLTAMGIAGYIFKEEAPPTLAHAIQTVVRGGSWFRCSSEESLLERTVGEPLLSKPPVLSHRELEVLRLVVAGRTNQQIAGALMLSRKTVEKDLGELFAKLDVTSRVGAAVWAVRERLV